MKESYSIPSIIGNNKVYRTATILWLLTVVVRTNTYVSQVISELNAPLKGEKLRKTNEMFTNLNSTSKKGMFETETELFRFYVSLLHFEMNFERDPSKHYPDSGKFNSEAFQMYRQSGGYLLSFRNPLVRSTPRKYGGI